MKQTELHYLDSESCLVDFTGLSDLKDFGFKTKVIEILYLKNLKKVEEVLRLIWQAGYVFKKGTGLFRRLRNALESEYTSYLHSHIPKHAPVDLWLVPSHDGWALASFDVSLDRMTFPKESQLDFIDERAWVLNCKVSEAVTVMANIEAQGVHVRNYDEVFDVKQPPKSNIWTAPKYPVKVVLDFSTPQISPDYILSRDYDNILRLERYPYPSIHYSPLIIMRESIDVVFRARGTTAKAEYEGRILPGGRVNIIKPKASTQARWLDLIFCDLEVDPEIRCALVTPQTGTVWGEGRNLFPLQRLKELSPALELNS